MRLLPLLSLTLVLAACSSAPREPLPPLAPPVGGLSADQEASLRGLGVPVVVPGEPVGFTLASLETDRQGPTASYTLAYRRDDGACFTIFGGNDGFGGPEMPLVSTQVRVADLGRRVRVYQAADDPGATSAQVWGLNTVVSETMDLDGAAALFLSDTQGGCRPVSLEEGARIVSGLRLLSAPGGMATGGRMGPASVGDLGPFAPADDVLDGAVRGTSPEAVADAVAARYGGDAGRVTVDVLAQESYEATALVTLLDLRDDSVRDERLRLTLTPVGDEWRLVQAGRQVRCQPGRGHGDWSAAACQ